ncbi:SpvB/TcaC N-terminal domain-containing protein [Streptomyces sp. NBC_01565]|uniref:SpvB/TcaC N-terminal domain-containing protein n=1 Tax=unclassified Streptomyces TaxID=2593676 RepID=UPI00224FD612|nr:SpvB/TcaC N-terminal domain-containing protein [Streptomyces sp. NBC_01565]MCX4539401.1 FG-GAP-like repeat-containing protein [Streptomyces sp. NBC_01565]
MSDRTQDIPDVHGTPAPAGGAGTPAAQPEPPALVLPKGGGALRGLGERFTPDALKGTGALTVPLGLSAGRGGPASPQHVLSYDSAAGNGPFGLGWSVDVPYVARTTDRGLPRYDGPEEDTFHLAGADDLVPALSPGPDGSPQPVRRAEGPYEIRVYRPRTEGLFARIERWTDTASGAVHWRTTGKDNTVSVFGRDPAARVADPADPHRIFRWLLEEVRDDRGNVAVYSYKSEDFSGVDPGAPHERNRLRAQPRGPAERHLKRIRYGNPDPGSASGFRFEAVLDYGEHDTAAPTPQEVRPWPVRQDPFSSHRAGFELRTYRLCRRILMFHRFAELGPGPVLVSSLDLGHAEDPAVTHLVSLTRKGYVPAGEGRGYAVAPAPALSLTYTEPVIAAGSRELVCGPGESAPRLDGGHRWTDLDGEGISGILTEQGGSWFYRANLGGGAVDGPRPVATLPALARSASAARPWRLADVTGEGRPALVAFDGGTPGYHCRTPDGGWAEFTAFRSLPVLDWSDPALRLTDLTGDGLPDLLLTADDGLTWYPSAGGGGFGDSLSAAMPRDEDSGPRLLCSDTDLSVHLADMTGDGLADLVRVSDGEIAYWPNQGHGRFGPKVVMTGAPSFGHPDRFDPRRVHLADIDGSGPGDLLYAAQDGVRIWCNRAGNAFGPPRLIPLPPATGLVAVADVLGRGTAALVLGEHRPDGEAHVRYVDLMAAGKPHLLSGADNGTGLHTAIRYQASTTHYLADKAAGRPWATRPPFPVQVVAEVVVRDTVAATELTTGYRYRHGHYDGVEREFRGFGYVEQRDTLTTAAAAGMPGELLRPPAVVRRWQHTGWYTERAEVSRRFADEYWPGDASTRLPDTALPEGLTAEEEREACRALRGRILREEVTADDGGPLAEAPYSVREHTYALRLLQPHGTSRHCVVLAHPGQALTVHTERRADQPRITHDLVLEADDWGNALRTATVAYPRGAGGPGPDPDPAVDTDAEQRRMWVTLTEQDVVNDVGAEGSRRVGVGIEARRYEIAGIGGNDPLFTPTVLEGALGAAARAEVPYHQDLSGAVPQRRLIARAVTTYASDDLSGELPRGEIGLPAVPWRSYQQVFADGHAEALLGAQYATDEALSEAGYVRRVEGAGWWAPSTRLVPDPGLFYQAVAAVDPFGATTEVEYDADALLPVRTTDPLGNVVRVRNNYRVLQPWLLTDANGNSSGVRFDALGLVVATAVLGKRGEGDRLDLTTAEPSPLDDPTATLEYDLFARPAVARTSAREQHATAGGRYQRSVTYTDGSGRIILAKAQAEPGPAPVRGPDGALLRGPDGGLVLAWTEDRWVGTGRVIHDNKGMPVKQYEPYFAPDDRFDTESDLVRYGVTAVLRYDPLGRPVRTEHPDGTFSETVRAPWYEESWDRNDTVRRSRWYAERAALPATDPRARAARQALAHDGTFTEIRYDPLGRGYATIVRGSGDERFRTTLRLDAQGFERAAVDARGLTAREQHFDMLGRAVRVRGADTGERRALPDVLGKPVRAWDARGVSLRWSHDALRRPTHSYAAAPAGPERLRVRYYYGESLADGAGRNLRTKLCLVLDGAGVVRTDRADFKGNVLVSERRLTADPVGEPDWSRAGAAGSPEAALVLAALALESAVHRTVTEYDALDRPTLVSTPDGSRTRPRYSAASLLESVEVHFPGTAAPTVLVRRTEHDAHGRRTLAELGCGATTRCAYEPDTFRPAAADTRTADGRLLRATTWTYDPVGNVVLAEDPAQDTVFFRNTAVGSARSYAYDPLYRLVSATGREHIGLTGPPGPASPALAPLPHANDSGALRPYTDAYAYDPVGNLLSVTHTAAGAGGFTRHHLTADDGNRLLAVSMPGDPEGTFSARYGYDAAGNIVSMPHLPALEWDADGRLVHADLGGGGNAHYQYDASGQRVRATLVDRGTTETRTYLGPAEIHRRTTAGRTVEQRTSLHITDGQERIALAETATVEEGRPVPLPRPAIRYQLADHLGSSVVELDQEAAVLSYEEYHPFGTTSLHARGDGVSRKRYRFTGRERDEETGFDHHGARYRAPWLGRWISPDPAGFVDGPNLYAYARGNPVRLADPSGRQAAGDRQDAGWWDQAKAYAVLGWVLVEPKGPSGKPLIDHKLFEWSDAPGRKAFFKGVLGFEEPEPPKEDRQRHAEWEKGMLTLFTVQAAEVLAGLFPAGGAGPGGPQPATVNGAPAPGGGRAGAPAATRPAPGPLPAHLKTDTPQEEPAQKQQTAGETPAGAGAGPGPGPGPAGPPTPPSPAPAGPPKPKAPGNNQLAPGATAKPSTKSHVGVERSLDKGAGEGTTNLAREVTLELILPDWPVGKAFPRIRIDLLNRTAKGMLEGLEVKFGEFARLTKNQEHLPKGPDGGTMLVVPHGKNAAGAGLPLNTPMELHLRVERWNWPVNH